jgi:hypothetical protein
VHRGPPTEELRSSLCFSHVTACSACLAADTELRHPHTRGLRRDADLRLSWRSGGSWTAWSAWRRLSWLCVQTLIPGARDGVLTSG